MTEQVGTVRWVKIDPNAVARGENGFQTRPDTFAAYRLWWPVYLPAHRDPQLGDVGSLLHYHVAWNRIPKTASRFGRNHAAYVIHEAWIAKWGRFCAPPIAPTPQPPEPWRKSENIERLLMGRVGPFDPTEDRRCPHRGCPLDEFTEPDAEGIRRCPWHLIRVRDPQANECRRETRAATTPKG